MEDLNAGFAGRVGLQQRVLPAYRAPFFDALAGSCQGGLSVFAGKPLPDENIVPAEGLARAQYAPAHNRHFGRTNSPFYQCWQPGILDWLEGWQPDALIVEANPRYPSNCQALAWMHARGRPVIGWGLGASRLEAGFSLAGVLALWRSRRRRRLIHALDVMVAYSRRGAQEYRQLGFPAERIFVAPNSVAPRPARPRPDRQPAFQDRPTVLFVGRLQRRKRVDNLLRACAGLPPDLQPRLWIVGDGPERQGFQTLAGEIYPRAQFLGALHGVELDAYWDSADLFVLPGTGGLAVQEAMAHALPVLVARGDGTQDDLVRRENGWQVTPDDLQSLSAALLEALSDPRRLRRMGDESFRIVSEEINLEMMVSAFVRALNFARFYPRHPASIAAKPE